MNEAARLVDELTTLLYETLKAWQTQDGRHHCIVKCGACRRKADNPESVVHQNDCPVHRLQQAEETNDAIIEANAEEIANLEDARDAADARANTECARAEGEQRRGDVADMRADRAERFAALWKRAAKKRRAMEQTACNVMGDLLEAESQDNARLRAELASARAVMDSVRRIAVSRYELQDEPGNVDRYWLCVLCANWWGIEDPERHTSDCPLMRAALAATPEQAADDLSLIRAGNELVREIDEALDSAGEADEKRMAARVIVEDLTTGERADEMLMSAGEYVVVVTHPCRVSAVQDWHGGRTVQLMLDGRDPDAGGAGGWRDRGQSRGCLHRDGPPGAGWRRCLRLRREPHGADAVRRTVIDASGLLDLGDQAHAAGYRPGAVVDVVRLSTGSLLVTLTDEPVIDLPPLKPLKPKGRQPALAAGRQR